MKLTDREKTLLLEWWGKLVERRGDRAVLSRSKLPSDILASRAFFNFLEVMPERWSEDGVIRFSDAAMVAAVAARIRENSDDRSFIQSLAAPKNGGNRPVMSELRFQRLLRVRDDEEFFIRVCRAIDLLGKEVSVVSVVENILLWNDENRCVQKKYSSKQLSFKWAKEYFENITKQ